MNLELDILQYSYWEHFKTAKDLSLIYGPEHPKRQELERVMTDLLDRINQLKQN